MPRFRTLGRLELVDGEPSATHVLPAQRKRLALLAYLLLARPRGPRKRDILLPLFWPELSEEEKEVVVAGTLVNRSLPPDQRLSWVAESLEYLSQLRQNSASLAEKLERGAAWDSDRNRDVAKTPIKLLLCPGAIPEQAHDSAAVAQIVGIGGIGPDGATLGLGPPVPNRAGCFRYDAPTPLPAIRENDGLSTTLLFGETRRDLGPWIRGGPSTVRMLDVTPGSAPLIGGQFGGNYPGLAGFALADGSARFFADRVNPLILQSMFTIAGRGEDPLIGE